MNAMRDVQHQITESLGAQFASVLHHTYAPYSHREEVVLLVLSDGSWVKGVRVENASYPLSIPAVMNALTTAASLGRMDVVLAMSNHKLEPYDVDYLEAALGVSGSRSGDDLWLSGRDLPNELGAPLPVIQTIQVANLQEGIAWARKAAENAWIPESGFPVGSMLLNHAGEAVMGCNVESVDWPKCLCAERNTISTAISYGLKDWKALYLSCPKLPGGTPCGACRQVLMEFDPELDVVLDMGDYPPKVFKAKDLLPHSFEGDFLRKE